MSFSDDGAFMGKIGGTGSQLSRILRHYSTRDRRKLKFVACAQVILSFLDLLGVAMIGALGALTVVGIQSKSPGNRVSAFLEFVHLSNFSFRTQAAILAVVAVSLMVLRSFLSVYLNKKILFFISLRTAKISGQMADRLMNEPLSVIKSQSTQQRLFELTSGISGIGIGIVGPLLQTLGDLSLLIILVVGLLSVDVLMTVLAFVIFSSFAALGYYFSRRKIGEAAKLNTELSISSSEKIVSLISMYREYYLRDSLKSVVNRFEEERLALAKYSSSLNFYPSVPKYFLETSIFVAVLALGAFQFSRLDAPQAISTLAIFLAAASRIAPASLRIQQSLVGIRNNIDMCLPAIELNELLSSQARSNKVSTIDVIEKSSKEIERFDLSINIKSFAFGGESNFKLRDIYVEIPEGSSLAIVGPSGSGKSTLVDLILGFLSSQDSKILIGGETAISLIRNKPGIIGYVPQEIPVLNGSIAENISLSSDTNDARVLEVLKNSELKEFVDSLSKGMFSIIGDRGMALSGGQRQRVGLARALYTNPKLLVMDEATSALDAVTESNIAESLKSLCGQVTTIVVAHRLSTVRAADKILYLENGRAAAIGNFEEVRRAVPDFDQQAKLMGL
jgi:ABC-type multidrug transport system fused ATPase/permease subunit